MTKTQKYILTGWIIGIAAVGALFLLAGDEDSSVPTVATEQQEQVKSREELLAEAKTLKHREVKTIKGVLEPKLSDIDTLLKKETNNLKELGVNTIYVYADHEYQDGEFILNTSEISNAETKEEKENEYIERIINIKNSGFAVHLAVSFNGYKEKPFGVSLEKLLEDAKEADLRWAGIAEDLKVETFAPSSGIDFQIFREYYGADRDNEEGFNLSVEIANRYHADIIDEIKNRFSGRVVYQAGLYSPKLGATGYDIFGQGVSPAGLEIAEFKPLVRRAYRYAETNAKRQGSSWMVTELRIPVLENTQDNTTEQLARTPTGTPYASIQDRLYSIAFEEYTNWDGDIPPAGFGFTSYINQISAVKNTPAEEIIKRFFTGLN